MGRERFESAYEGQPPWDIPGPQPEFVRLEATGMIRGSVLDAGCGTGENALYLASRGHEVWGLFIPVAIEGAKAKERGLGVDFQVGDALKLDQLGRTFDTVIDCGLFHTFADEERPLYVSGLATVVRPGGSSTSFASAIRNRPVRDRGGSPSRRSVTPSVTAGRSPRSRKLGFRRRTTR